MQSENSSSTTCLLQNEGTSSDQENFHDPDLQSMNAENVPSNVLDLYNALNTSPLLYDDAINRTQQYNNSLNAWVEYRTNLIRVMKEACAQLDVSRKKCLVATKAGSSIGIVSTLVALVAFTVFPPLAVVATIIATAAGLTGVVSQCLKMRNRIHTMNGLQEYVENDELLLETTMFRYKHLADLVNVVMHREYFLPEMNREIDISEMTMSVISEHTRRPLQKHMAFFWEAMLCVGSYFYAIVAMIITGDIPCILLPPLRWSQAFASSGLGLAIFMWVKCSKVSRYGLKLIAEIERLSSMMQTELNTIPLNTC